MFVFPYVIFYIKIKWQVISFSMDPYKSLVTKSALQDYLFNFSLIYVEYLVLEVRVKLDIHY